MKSIKIIKVNKFEKVLSVSIPQNTEIEVNYNVLSDVYRIKAHPDIINTINTLCNFGFYSENYTNLYFITKNNGRVTYDNNTNILEIFKKVIGYRYDEE